MTLVEFTHEDLVPADLTPVKTINQQVSDQMLVLRMSDVQMTPGDAKCETYYKPESGTSLYVLFSIRGPTDI